jgi:hypothetical protein
LTEGLFAKGLGQEGFDDRNLSQFWVCEVLPSLFGIDCGTVFSLLDQFLKQLDFILFANGKIRPQIAEVKGQI